MSRKRPRIVVDADIPGVAEEFAEIGTILPISGQNIGPCAVKSADALIVRSITPINARLLEGSRVRFVGSATAGTDHVDRSWLKKANIDFAHAPGANAESVVEYVFSVMAEGLARSGKTLDSLTLGIVGCGQVGERLARRAEYLGLQVIRNDPPREAVEGPNSMVHYSSLDELLKRSDIVSVHVPLVKGGPHATEHLVGDAELAQMPAGSWLIQSSRGGTCDEDALIERRRSDHLGFLAVDVWETEPRPNPGAVRVADVATPHIAGYSRDAKRRGIQMIRAALIETLAPHEPRMRGRSSLEKGNLVRRLTIPESVRSDRTKLFIHLVRAMYDIRGDDRRFREGMQWAGVDPERSMEFHRQRAQYPVRRSFRRFAVHRSDAAGSAVMITHGLGVQLLPA